jgi:hypothetical protein
MVFGWRLMLSIQSRDFSICLKNLRSLNNQWRPVSNRLMRQWLAILGQLSSWRNRLADMAWKLGAGEIQAARPDYSVNLSLSVWREIISDAMCHRIGRGPGGFESNVSPDYSGLRELFQWYMQLQWAMIASVYWPQMISVSTVCWLWCNLHDLCKCVSHYSVTAYTQYRRVQWLTAVPLSEALSGSTSLYSFEAHLMKYDCHVEMRPVQWPHYSAILFDSSAYVDGYYFWPSVLCRWLMLFEMTDAVSDDLVIAWLLI